MKKLVIATSIALCLSLGVNTTSFATDNDKKEQMAPEKQNELIGFSSGAVTGALVAGPLGAIVGSVIGVLVAEDVNNDKQIKDSTKQLQLAKGKLEVEKQQSKALQTELIAMQRQQMVQLASLDEQTNDVWLDDLSSFETKLQFKTASFVIEDIYREQLSSLASILSAYPQLKINITGYADSRGDANYNQNLSMQRAQAVENYLLSQSVNKEQLIVKGAGEIQLSSDGSKDIKASPKAESNIATLEDLFFARKVNIKFAKGNTNMTAAN